MNTKPKIAALVATASVGIAAVVIGLAATSHVNPPHLTAAVATTSHPVSAKNADVSVPTAQATPIVQDTPTPVPTVAPTPTATPVVTPAPAGPGGMITCPPGYRAVFTAGLPYPQDWSCQPAPTATPAPQ